MAHFGIQTAEAAALALDFQVAQKLHACTDPHSDSHRNDRAHDAVDLLMVREAFFTDADLPVLRRACEAIFAARAMH